ncbi:MAG: hypothetical protein V8S32_12520 [Lachnospiraceae bacterium]
MIGEDRIEPTRKNYDKSSSNCQTDLYTLILLRFRKSSGEADIAGLLYLFLLSARGRRHQQSHYDKEDPEPGRMDINCGEG